jgi:hypothetical protein
MLTKETLNSGTALSQDAHIQAMGRREDELVTRIQKWVEGYCDQIAK